MLLDISNYLSVVTSLTPTKKDQGIDSRYEFLKTTIPWNRPLDIFRNTPILVILFHISSFHRSLRCLCQYSSTHYTNYKHKSAIDCFVPMSPEPIKPSIGTLSTELYMQCMGNITDIKSLVKFSMTSRRAKAIFEENRMLMYVTINQIGPDLIPIAIVRFAAKNRCSRLLSALNACKSNPEDERKLRVYVNCVYNFFKTYLDKVMTLTDPRLDFTPQIAHEFLEFHKTISDFVNMIIDH